MKVHIAVGSNIDPDVHVPAGLARLHAQAPIVAASRFYRTPAIDRPDQGDYWNAIVVVETQADPDDFADLLRDTEAAEGRVRAEDKWAARELDLDVLLVDGLPVDGAQREVAQRDFLRWCLADLAGRPDQDAGPRAPFTWP